MTTPRSHWSYDLLEEVGTAVDREADALDMQTVVFVRALVAGALKRGMAASLALEAIEAGLVPEGNARPRPALKWERAENGDLIHGPWRMVRFGPTRNERNKRPGDGWYLYGPGLDKPKNLDAMARHVAQRTANAYIISRQGEGVG